MTTTFILGGARSGKSARALRLAGIASDQRVFIATAEALDEEMTARIARHQAERNESWETVEAPLDLVDAIERRAADDRIVVVDCLTLWLSNLMHHERDIEIESANLVTALTAVNGDVILVSNEVGLGLVPEDQLGRNFRDLQGRLNQSVASACDVVEFVAAGLPIRLKG